MKFTKRHTRADSNLPRALSDTARKLEVPIVLTGFITFILAAITMLLYMYMAILDEKDSATALVPLAFTALGIVVYVVLVVARWSLLFTRWGFGRMHPDAAPSATAVRGGVS